MTLQSFNMHLNDVLGNIRIDIREGCVTKLAYLSSQTPPDQIADEKISSELVTYLTNPRHIVNLTCRPEGTPFQKRVWQALQGIPAGTTLTYGELATKLDSHARAIGQACRHNPIPIIIPCHRVVSKVDFGGYAGATTGKLIRIKQWLLNHEQK